MPRFGPTQRRIWALAILLPLVIAMAGSPRVTGLSQTARLIGSGHSDLRGIRRQAPRKNTSLNPAAPRHRFKEPDPKPGLHDKAVSCRGEHPERPMRLGFGLMPLDSEPLRLVPAAFLNKAPPTSTIR